MNWATIEPEHRLYKGKNLFRWDVSPGLEHHCGTCATPLHNARAKTSCLGKHVEPCYRFHQQLHFVGKSHECFGCNHSDEMHHIRHKEILKIIRKIAALDDLHSPTQGSISTSSSKLRRSSAMATNATDTSSESFVDDGRKLKRSERKKAKKSGMIVNNKRKKVEAFPQEDLDFVSEAIHLTIHESKGAWEGTYVYDKTPQKTERSIIEKGEAPATPGHVGGLCIKSPAELTPRQRRISKKFTNAINHSSFRGGSRKYTPKPNSDLYDGVDPQIFFRLGIEVVNPPVSSVARKDLVSKLVEAVKADLAIITQEEEECVMREEGFWRWAGKAAYHSIMKIRQELDWATGQKKTVKERLFDEETLEEDLFEEDTITHETAFRGNQERTSVSSEDFDSSSESFDLNDLAEEVEEIEHVIEEFDRQTISSPRRKKWSQVKRTGELEITVR